MDSQDHYMNIHKVYQSNLPNYVWSVEISEEKNISEKVWMKKRDEKKRQFTDAISVEKRTNRVWSHLNEMKRIGIMGGIQGRMEERQIRRGKKRTILKD